MRNWSIDTTKSDKKSRQYIIWKLEQLINFGLENEKIDLKELKTYFSSLTLDPSKKRFIKFLLEHA